MLPPPEQVPGENYEHGSRLRCYVVQVRKGARGPSIMLSRTHPNLVRKLFALEVPEIADGTVEIAAVAREAGHRTKIAVKSNRPGVNAKGSCIGPMGSRARAVMVELHGEKIDIVDWSEDPARFLAEALQPAKVLKVEIVDLAARSARITVPDYQLSLAIGKEGQNARLAARLTGWRIDIRPDVTNEPPPRRPRSATPRARSEPAGPHLRRVPAARRRRRPAAGGGRRGRRGRPTRAAGCPGAAPTCTPTWPAWTSPSAAGPSRGRCGCPPPLDAAARARDALREREALDCPGPRADPAPSRRGCLARLAASIEHDRPYPRSESRRHEHPMSLHR